MKKTKITNLIASIISAYSIYMIIKIDNLSRLSENINTDYYMRSLPYLYLIIFSISVSFIISLILLKEK